MTTQNKQGCVLEYTHQIHTPSRTAAVLGVWFTPLSLYRERGNTNHTLIGIASKSETHTKQNHTPNATSKN